MKASVLEPAVAPSPADDDGEDDLTHVVCCDITLALCGRRLPEADGWVWDDGLVDCVVCRDLMGGPCHAFECPYRG